MSKTPKHIRAYRRYRERERKPKADLSEIKEKPLTFEKYRKLLRVYTEPAEKHLNLKRKKHKYTPRPPWEKVRVSKANLTYPVIREIIKDFKRTKNLKVFGFGVGYAPLLFFLKKYMGAKVKGVELQEFPRHITKGRGLGIQFGKSVEDPSLKKLGERPGKKFDVTFSTAVLEMGILSEEKAKGMLDNAASLTRKGGKSYHLLWRHSPPLKNPRKEIKKRGFKIDKWKKRKDGSVFIKLTKERN